MLNRFDREIVPNGPISQGYENYVRNVFQNKNPMKVTKNNELSSFESLPFPKTGINFNNLTKRSNNYASSTPTADTLNFDGFGTVGEGCPKNVSAVTMLRIENQFGKEALDDSYDNTVLKTSLDSIYAELGIDKLMGSNRLNVSTEYAVYTPKYSYRVDNLNNSELSTNSFNLYREELNDKWKKTNKQMLVDYKDFDSSPLSPYMYQRHPFVQQQDSRIVGSNFVQLTTRPRDRFLEKIDQTLAQARSISRY